MGILHIECWALGCLNLLGCLLLHSTDYIGKYFFQTELVDAELSDYETYFSGRVAVGKIIPKSMLFAH